MPSNDPLDTLQQRIDAAKDTIKAEGEHGKPDDGRQGVATAMRMGIELVSGVAIGSVIGYFVDRWLNTMPLFFIICFFIGAAAGFRNMLRDASRQKD